MIDRRDVMKILLRRFDGLETQNTLQGVADEIMELLKAPTVARPTMGEEDTETITEALFYAKQYVNSMCRDIPQDEDGDPRPGSEIAYETNRRLWKRLDDLALKLMGSDVTEEKPE